MNIPDISDELLVDLAEGLLSPTDERALRAQVAANPQRAAELARLEALIALMRQDTTEDAPGHVISQAQRIFQPAPPVTGASSPMQDIIDAGADVLRQVIAVLQFDSFRTPQAYGVRQSGIGPEVRQVLYNADTYDIDLRIAPHDGSWQISGQVLGPDDEDTIVGTVELGSTTPLTSVPCNDFGEFVLPPVPAGSYRLIVRLPDLAITIESLEVGQSQK
ncbi:MAG: hypothetical protein ACLFVO_20145 [Chloroflexaceae bacterium]